MCEREGKRDGENVFMCKSEGEKQTDRVTYRQRETECV